MLKSQGMRIIVFVVLILTLPFFVQSKDITTVKGFAPKYVGKEINIYQIVDYLSLKEERIASVTVGSDSTFICSFYLEETRKLIVEADKNRGQIYAQPGTNYTLFLPDKNPYDPYRPLGNLIEVSFIDLDSTDVNYKILEFNRWSDEFVARYYTRSNADKSFFVKRLDTFKLYVKNYYVKDTANVFLMNYIKYGIAKIDDFRFKGARNQYEKFDFYLRNAPVCYQCDNYMNYVNHFYERLMPRISKDVNDSVYKGILASSPTKVMNSFRLEYTLQNNLKLRELVMIKCLGDLYFEKDYPQTNILTILDSVAQFARFEGNKIIAKNIIQRLTELSDGGKAPDFIVELPTGSVSLTNFQGKHLYLIFLSTDNEDGLKELELLLPIYQKYKKNVTFLSILETEKEKTDKSVKDYVTKVPWATSVVAKKSDVFKKYQVIRPPYYVLIDPIGYIVNVPALGPKPNGKYQTIDEVFFQIEKVLKEGNSSGR